MTKKDAVEIILAGKRAAARSGCSFVVDRFRLGSISGFSEDAMNEIECAVASIEAHAEYVLSSLD